MALITTFGVHLGEDVPRPYDPTPSGYEALRDSSGQPIADAGDAIIYVLIPQ